MTPVTLHVGGTESHRSCAVAEILVVTLPRPGLKFEGFAMSDVMVGGPSVTVTLVLHDPTFFDESLVRCPINNLFKVEAQIGYNGARWADLMWCWS